MVNGAKRCTSSVDLNPPSWNGLVGGGVSLSGEVDKYFLVPAPDEGPGGKTIWNQVESPLGGVEVELFSSPSYSGATWTPASTSRVMSASVKCGMSSRPTPTRNSFWV